MTAEPAETDYTAIPEHRLPETCGDDAAKWATAFCQHARKLGDEIDEGWMIGWFANAIEASWDKRVRRPLPRAQKSEATAKAWAIRDLRSSVDAPGFWSGDDVFFVTDLARAVLFVRKQDAERVLAGNPVIPGTPVPVAAPSEEPA